MSNFKKTKTILENINEQNDRINECVDIVNGYTTDEETRVNQEIQRQQNELLRQQNEIARQEQIDNIMVNSAQFGTSITKDDNTEELQSAIDYVFSRGGGTVLLNEGVYKIENVKLKSNVTLRGVSLNSVLKLKRPAENWLGVISIGGVGLTVNNAKIENITLDGNYTDIYDLNKQQSHTIMIMQNSSNIIIDNVICKNTAGDGIWIATTVGNDVLPKEIKIKNCKFIDNKRQNISLCQWQEVTIDNCYGNGTLDVETENSTMQSKNCFIINSNFNICSIMNYTVANNSNIQCFNNIFGNAFIWVVKGVNFSNNVTDKIQIRACDDVTISNNRTSCIEIIGVESNKSSNITLIGNTINNISSGLSANDKNKTSIYLYKTNNIIIKNNVIKTKNDFIGITLDGANVDINILDNIISTSDSTVNGINILSNDSKNINIISNSLLNFYNGIKSSGSNSIDGSIVKNNIIDVSNIPLQYANVKNCQIISNSLKGSASCVFNYINTMLHKDNFYNSNYEGKRYFEIYNSNYIKTVKNTFLLYRDGMMAIYNTPNVLLIEEISNNSIALSGATLLQGSRYYTKEVDKIGKYFNGTSWVNINI